MTGALRTAARRGPPAPHPGSSPGAPDAMPRRAPLPPPDRPEVHTRTIPSTSPLVPPDRRPRAATAPLATTPGRRSPRSRPGSPGGSPVPTVIRILRFFLQPRALIRAPPAELVSIASHVGDRHVAMAILDLELLQVLQALVEGRTEHLPHKAQLIQELNALLVHLAVAVAGTLIPHPGTERCPIRQHGTFTWPCRAPNSCSAV